MQLPLCCPYASSLFKSHSCSAADHCNRQEGDFRRAALIPTAFSERRNVFLLSERSTWQKKQTSSYNCYLCFLELILVLITFSQLKTDRVKQSNILLRSYLVKRILDGEITINSEYNITSKSIRIASFAFSWCRIFSLLCVQHHTQ